MPQGSLWGTSVLRGFQVSYCTKILRGFQVPNYCTSDLFVAPFQKITVQRGQVHKPAYWSKKADFDFFSYTFSCL